MTHECPHCGCEHIFHRGNYAGNPRYVNDVQCLRCHRWYSELPGGGKSKSLAQRRADAALKPTKPQESCDIGLFGDDAQQLDFADRTDLKPRGE